MEFFSPSLLALMNHQRQEESLRESRSQILEDLLRHRLLHYQAGIQPNLAGIMANHFLHQQHFEGVITPPSMHISGLSFGLNRTYPSLLPIDELGPDRSANTERVALATDPVWPGSRPRLASIPQLPPWSFPVPSRYDLREGDNEPNMEASGLFTLPPREFPPKCLPVILAIQDDGVKLSPRQAFLRLQIEAFEASEDEVAVHARGRNKKIKLRQVGIRCRHCAHLPVVMKQKGSTYFPATLAGLYQAGQNMCSIHFQSGRCKNTPAAVKRQFVSFMSTRGGGLGVGSPYWADAANQLGLVNSDDGIRFVSVLSSSVSKDRADSKTLAAG